jgi:hypothetical protein
VAVDPVDRPEHRLGDEVEPAPVDQQLELVDAVLLLAKIDNVMMVTMASGWWPEVFVSHLASKADR